MGRQPRWLTERFITSDSIYGFQYTFQDLLNFERDEQEHTFCSFSEEFKQLVLRVIWSAGNSKKNRIWWFIPASKKMKLIHPSLIEHKDKDDYGEFTYDDEDTE